MFFSLLLQQLLDPDRLTYRVSLSVKSQCASQVVTHAGACDALSDVAHAVHDPRQRSDAVPGSWAQPNPLTFANAIRRPRARLRWLT